MVFQVLLALLYLFHHLLLIASRTTATLTTIILCFIALVILGIYLGKVSRKSLLKTSIEIVLIGILIGVVSFLISGGHYKNFYLSDEL